MGIFFTLFYPTQSMEKTDKLKFEIFSTERLGISNLEVRKSIIFLSESHFYFKITLWEKNNHLI